jgi:hypothetical protein
MPCRWHELCASRGRLWFCERPRGEIPGANRNPHSGAADGVEEPIRRGRPHGLNRRGKDFSPNRCHVGRDLRVKPQRRRRNALRHQVDHCRLAAAHGFRNRAGQLVDGVYEFTITSQRTREKVVTGR